MGYLEMEDHESHAGEGLAILEDRVSSFEGLVAWQTARDLVRITYAVFRKSPAAHDFGLRDQAQRAAVSVMTNLAEGFERMHVGEKLQYYNVARASCGEVRSLSYVMLDMGYMSPEEHEIMRSRTIDTGRLISGLIRVTRGRTDHL